MDGCGPMGSHMRSASSNSKSSSATWLATLMCFDLHEINAIRMQDFSEGEQWM